VRQQSVAHALQLLIDRQCDGQDQDQGHG
jgi:hypothetical protein